MKKGFIFFSMLTMLLFTVYSCEDGDEELVPTSISNLRSEAREGVVMLKWDIPADSNYFFLEVSYDDPRIARKVKKLASIYTDSILIDELLNRFGNYKFSVQPFSTTYTPGQIVSIEAACLPVQPSYSILSEREMKLTADNLYTNAQESSEGAIINLLDNDGSTFFHSSWSKDIPGTHYLQLNFSEPLKEQGFKFKFKNRANSANKPSIIEISISEDGTNFTTVTTIDEGLPTTSGSEYTAEPILLMDFFQPKHIRFSVLQTNSGTSYFTMADFWFYECVVGIVDPEHDAL
ncbi:MAG: hypothetical protein EZS26_003558 [Candidatus Ordinivivax streblomastigis]|uniref:F5/8 type C domain-containing protein n=1 Tax=Candidatus Ordinivivax streblomastigis TaxID=2540710 RepID=A0A5M8NVE9_9BACT|nr:MAG: hypothetical protein EZS26_003558 [Candidatus Ordinivivax streblomastigis]